MADELKGKIAVITGGSRGLGYAIAQAYNAAGAAVVIAGRSQSTLDKAVGGLLNGGGRASGLAVDVGSHEQVEALAEHAVRTFGRIDIWVNNAGMGAPYGPTMQVPPACLCAGRQHQHPGHLLRLACRPAPLRRPGIRQADQPAWPRLAEANLCPCRTPTPPPRSGCTPSPWRWQRRQSRAAPPASASMRSTPAWC